MHASGNFQWDEKYPNQEVFDEDIRLEQLWVAEVDGAIAGVAAITTDQYPEYAKAGLDVSETAIVVHRLAAHPAYRGRGIALALMNEAEEEARRRAIPVLRVDTNSKNAAAQQLFARLAYRFAGEMPLAFRGDLRFFCYEKRL